MEQKEEENLPLLSVLGGISLCPDWLITLSWDTNEFS